MQDDWAKWVPMIEFSDNNNVTSATQMSHFYMNKGFHPCMSLARDTTDYETTRKRLQARTVADITARAEEIANLYRSPVEPVGTYKSSEVQRQGGRRPV